MKWISIKVVWLHSVVFVAHNFWKCVRKRIKIKSTALAGWYLILSVNGLNGVNLTIYCFIELSWFEFIDVEISKIMCQGAPRQDIVYSTSNKFPSHLRSNYLYAHINCIVSLGETHHLPHSIQNHAILK